MSVPQRTRASLDLRAGYSYITREILLPAQRYIHTEGLSGFVLLAAAVAALFWANSPWSAAYERLWHVHFTATLGPFTLGEDLRHWINDGLMAIFFFVVGLEVKREMTSGGLAQWRRALLPAIAAVGGMVVPALLFAAFNSGTEAIRGWGIPMATDIAFALGALALLGSRIPHSLRVLLLALAVVDDIGAILVIAIFYSGTIVSMPLISAVVLVALILILQRLGVRRPGIYAVIGFFFWLAVLESGIHATIAGVVLGLLTPSTAAFSHATFDESLDALRRRFHEAMGSGDHDQAEAVLGHFEELARGTEPPLERIERYMHFWSSFVVLPIFAFANAGVVLSYESLRAAAFSPLAHGVAVGLVGGKVAGIVGFTFLAVKARLVELPSNISWQQFTGMGVLAGIGFTVSLFISDLAFENEAMVAQAKIAILFASVVAGALGYIFLRLTRAALSQPT